MEKIILLNGNVKYQITLDPGVWIFDKRRIDLTTYFHHRNEQTNELEDYTRNISKVWDREVSEGSAVQSKGKAEKEYEKEKVLNGTFGIPFKPFLMNAEPNKDAKSLVIHLSKGEVVEIPLEKAYDLIVGFSENGRPYNEYGPIRIFYGDGTNVNTPIKNVVSLSVK